jgi:hypothetical protein
METGSKRFVTIGAFSLGITALATASSLADDQRTASGDRAGEADPCGSDLALARARSSQFGHAPGSAASESDRILRGHRSSWPGNTPTRGPSLNLLPSSRLATSRGSHPPAVELFERRHPLPRLIPCFEARGCRFVFGAPIMIRFNHQNAPTCPNHTPITDSLSSPKTASPF